MAGVAEPGPRYAGRRRRAAALGLGGAVGRGAGAALLLLAVIVRGVDAQAQFRVDFPVANELKFQPFVDCIPEELVARPCSQDAAQLCPISLPQALGSCTECTEVGGGACINQFVIQATALDPFTFLFEPITECTLFDTLGNPDDLNSRRFRVSMELKAPSFAAPNGHTISGLGDALTCVNGQFVVKYTTSIAGQYRTKVEMFDRITAGGVEIWNLLKDANNLDEGGAFERAATDVLPGQKVNYFIDSILSFRPPCNAANALLQACKDYCKEPSFTGGCAGNTNIPQAYSESQMIFSAGDRFFNTIKNEFPACTVGEQVLVTAEINALKQPSVSLSDCQENTAGKTYCRSLATSQRSTEYSLNTCGDGSECINRCGSTACLETCANGVRCPATCTDPYYFIKFLPTISGFYSMTVQIFNEEPLGPIVVPVKAAAVSAVNSVAFGEGLFGAVESENVAFEIQPKDQYGNHHTQGVHVFQVFITGETVNIGAGLQIIPVDTGHGSSLAMYALELPGVYRIKVTFCKDIIKYPPYVPGDQTVCNLESPDGTGVQIQDSEFSVRIDPVQFDVIGSTAPAMMERFSTALVGARFYVLFTMNFLACGQTWPDTGTPVGVRYQPTLRFDPSGLTYLVNPPPSKTLTANQVTTRDSVEGRFDQVRYAEFSGHCLPEGYVMTFFLTVSGTYNVWVYTDTENERIVAGSPKVLDVLADVAVLPNYRATGEGLFCVDTRLCMANQDTTFTVQAKDRFFNNADSCYEQVQVFVEPAFAGADQFSVTNLVEEQNVGGVSINGQPGQGIDVVTLSGYVGKPILPFNGTVTTCVTGGYQIALRATLSADYRVHITVNNTILQGSPFDLTIHPQTQTISLGTPVAGLVAYNRWTYYAVYFDTPNEGFVVEVVKTDENKGQPWTYVRYAAIWEDIQEPEGGIRTEYPTARQSIYCRTCRIHVPPNKGQVGFWYVAVFGHEDDSYHIVTATKYSDQALLPGEVKTGTLSPGHYAYYHFTMVKESGFQVRASVTTEGAGELTATLKKDSWPTVDTDTSSVFGVALRSGFCQDCIVDHPPTFLAAGSWYMSILAHTIPVDFQVALIEFQETDIVFGAKPNELSLPLYTWGFYTFTIDPDVDPDALQLQVIPSQAGFNVTTVLKRSDHPISTTDSTFNTEACTHCRVTVMTRQKFQATWYMGVYTGSTGGTFNIRMNMYESCPNDCFGNGECVQRKTRACVCYPGYTGIDCRDALKDKTFAWHPLDVDTLDVSGNKRPLFYKINRFGETGFLQGGLKLLDSYIIMPKPKPAVVCRDFHKIGETDPKNYQWEAQVDVNEGTAAINQVTESIPGLGEWYTWNELGDPTAATPNAGNPTKDMACAEYNPRREVTTMFRVRIEEPLPSPGSLFGIGKASRQFGRADVNEKNQWSWMVYPRQHPNGINILVDLLLRNDTHEISLREQQIWPIDGIDLFEKTDFWLRKFPNYCSDGPEPTNLDGICELMLPRRWYHIAAVFGPKFAELWIDGVYVAGMNLDLWNITDVKGGRVHFGHDPRFAFYERLMFGQVRDMRVLLYAASKEEIQAVAVRGESWFTWREAQRQATGEEVTTRGTWTNPIGLAAIDDGTLDMNSVPHEEVCREYRNPNEPRSIIEASKCPFIDSHAAWMLREMNDHNYRKYDTDRTPYGLGYEMLILKDTREFAPVYLGRFYDWSIDEE